jgi:hypothetical protein
MEFFMNTVTTRNVVEKICQYLGDCSQRVLCRYLGVTTVALSQNIERQFSEIIDNRVGKRLDALLYLLECVKKDETLEPSTLHRLITLPSYPDKSGWKIDVASAIHEEYAKEVIVEVFLRALEQLRRPVDKNPVERGLYQAIHATA